MCAVLIYAKLSSENNRLPRRLLLVPASLLISAGLFGAAFLTAWSDWGMHPDGAKVKYACWGSALLVEIIAHIIRFQMDANQGIRLRSHGSVSGRLSDITTILLGEVSDCKSGLLGGHLRYFPRASTRSLAHSMLSSNLPGLAVQSVAQLFVVLQSCSSWPICTLRVLPRSNLFGVVLRGS